jgi:2'-5' RNA ligase
VIVLIPDGLDEIEYKDGDRAPAHSTLAYMGSTADATDEELEEVRRTAERLAHVCGPFEASRAGLATLGEHQDEVMLVEAQEIQDLHDVLLSDETCRRLLAERNEHPHFIPHVSYPHAKAPDTVRFSKIGCWIGDDRVEYDL